MLILWWAPLTEERSSLLVTSLNLGGGFLGFEAASADCDVKHDKGNSYVVMQIFK